MFPALSDDRTDMIVSQRVEDRFAFPPAGHQLGTLEDLELMGNRGLGHAEDLCQIAHAHLCFKQNKEDADPGGVAEHFEKLCQIIKLFFCGHLLIHRLQDIGVHLKAFTAI